MSALRRILFCRSLPAGIRTLSETTVGAPNVVNLPSRTDQCNPIPGYNYVATESFPVFKVKSAEGGAEGRGGVPEVPYFKPPPPAETGIHCITGEEVKFPYFHCRDACYDDNVTIT